MKELLSGPQGQAFYRTTEYTVCMPHGGWPSAGQVQHQSPEMKQDVAAVTLYHVDVFLMNLIYVSTIQIFRKYY